MLAHLIPILLLVAGGLEPTSAQSVDAAGPRDAEEIAGANLPGTEAGAKLRLTPPTLEPEPDYAMGEATPKSRGFSVELRVGFGRLWGRFDDLRADGTSLPLAFSAGLSLTDDLLLFGEVFDVHAFTSADLTSHVDLYGFGPGLKYYATPTDFFLSGSVLWSSFRYRNEGWEPMAWPKPYPGLSGRLSLGKAWRLGQKWHLGVSGELVLGRSWPANFEAFTHVVMGLVTSLGYDSDGRPSRSPATSTTAPSASAGEGLAPFGLYLDARLGLGGLWASSGNLLISGVTVPFGVAAGLSLTSDLVVFAEVSRLSMINPGVNRATRTILDFTLYGAGLGLKYYLTPKKIFCSGSVSIARLRYQHTESYDANRSSGDTSHWGAWTRFAVGREWPVGPHWSVGLAGEFLIGRMGQGAQARAEFYEADAYVPKGLSLVLLASYGSPTEPGTDGTGDGVDARSPIPIYTVAQAQSIAPTTPSLGPSRGTFLSLGVGVGTAAGRLDSRNDADASDTLGGVSKAFPFTLGVGYRFSPHWSTDVILGYVPISFAKQDCAVDYGSANEVRLGAALRWHGRSYERLAPWVSLGLGADWFGFNSGTCADVRALGYDLDVQIGSETRVSRSWTIGPYASARAGTYKYLRVSPTWRGASTQTLDLPLSDMAMHVWFTIGIRGTFSSVR